MIAAILLVSISPPLVEGPYDWCVIRYVNFTEQEKFCAQPQDVPPPVNTDNALIQAPRINAAPKDTLAARKLAMEQFAKIEPSQVQRDKWAKGTALTTPGTGRELAWVMFANEADYVTIRVTNRTRYNLAGVQ